MGTSYRLIDQQQTATSSPALEINVESTDSEETSSIFTGTLLDDLGMAAHDAEFTLALWIKRGGNQVASLVTAANSLPQVRLPHRPRLNDPFLFLVRTGTLVKQLGRRSHSGLVVVSEDTWHHLGWTVQAGVWRVFVDGVLVNERYQPSEADVPGEIQLAVGAVHRAAGSSAPFRGALDDLRIYGRALPGSAVRALSQGGL